MNKDLAVKHRPQKWQEFKGHSNYVHMLKKQALSKEGLSNGYIIYGPSGVGKTTLARLFFKALTCSNVQEDGNPCLTCDNCTSINIHLKEINCGEEGGVNNIRGLIKTTRHEPLFGNFRGFLLDECQKLSSDARNCLLKPIEEAPDDVFWFFVTTEFDRIPENILTRCQWFELKHHSLHEIIERLKEIVELEEIIITDEKLEEIAGNCGSNLRRAIHLLQQNRWEGEHYGSKINNRMD